MLCQCDLCFFLYVLAAWPKCARSLGLPKQGLKVKTYAMVHVQTFRHYYQDKYPRDDKWTPLDGLLIDLEGFGIEAITRKYPVRSEPGDAYHRFLQRREADQEEAP